MRPAMQRHHSVRELIPWYVNGTLDEREMDLVSAHIVHCESCAAEAKKEVSLARRLRAQPAELAPLLALEASALNVLQSAMKDEPTSASLPHLQRLQRWQWQTAAASAAAVLVIVATTSFMFGRASFAPSYEVLTTSQPFGGTVIQLIFNPRASEQDIRQLLTDTGGVLLGSPSERGVYRIGLPARPDGRAYASRLQAHPAVRWAEVEL